MSFELEVFNKALGGRVWVGEYSSLTMTPRHNQQPTGNVVVPSDHGRVPNLLAKGARYRLRYDGEFLSSGVVRAIASDGLGPEQDLTCQLVDDWRILRAILAWQVPGSAIGSQGAAEYAVYTGPAETVVKSMLAANVARLGGAMRPAVTIAPDLGRGATITVQARMDWPADVLFPLVDQAGIGITVRHLSGTSVTVDCYEPATFGQELSYPAGTLAADSTWTREAPTVTRVVVAGPGEGTARIHRLYVDAAREAEWGVVLERKVDARDIKADDPNLEALMSARGAEALAEGAETHGLALKLAETSRFRYGAGGIHVGDEVTAELAPGVTVTDLVREATLSHTADRGLTAQPVLGQVPDADSATALTRAIGALAKAARTDRTGA